MSESRYEIFEIGGVSAYYQTVLHSTSVGKNAKGSRTKGVDCHCFFQYSLHALILLIFFRVRFCFCFCSIYMHLNSMKVDWSGRMFWF